MTHAGQDRRPRGWPLSASDYLDRQPHALDRQPHAAWRRRSSRTIAEPPIWTAKTAWMLIGSGAPIKPLGAPRSTASACYADECALSSGLCLWSGDGCCRRGARPASLSVLRAGVWLELSSGSVQHSHFVAPMSAGG